MGRQVSEQRDQVQATALIWPHFLLNKREQLERLELDRKDSLLEVRELVIRPPV